ncbi:hypothetical protein Tco_1319206 [Tanacetum coccineum]
MFDEYFQPSLSVVSRMLPAVAPIPTDTTGTPSSTSLDQDAPFASTLPTTHETQSSVIYLELSYEESSSRDVILANLHPANQPFEHLSKWIKNHPLDNVIGNPSCANLDVKEPNTILHKLRGVVYINKNNGKYLIRDDELYKFSDGTLKPVHDILNSMLHNFELGYNNASMPKRAWTEKDQNRTVSMLKKIDAILMERWIMRSLECFVSGRRIETDYRLLTRTK